MLTSLDTVHCCVIVNPHNFDEIIQRFVNVNVIAFITLEVTAH